MGPLNLGDLEVMNGCSLRFEYVCNSPEFALMTWDVEQKYKFVITKCVLHLLTRDLQPNVYEDIARTLKTKPAIMPFRKWSLMPIHLPSQQEQFITESLTPGGVMPNRVFIALVPTSSFVGEFATNGYTFGRSFPGDATGEADVKSISCLLNGVTVDGLASDNGPWEDIAFVRLYKTLGYWGTNTSCSVSVASYSCVS